MIPDSLTVPFREIANLSSAYTLTRKTIAVQWLLGNILILFVLLASIGLFILFKYIRPVEAEPKHEMKNSTKLFSLLYVSIVFVIGVLITNFLLDMWFLLLWCFLYATVLFILFKWKSLFVRYDYSMPAGWLVVYISVIIIALFSFNIIPSMVSTHDVQTEINQKHTTKQ